MFEKGKERRIRSPAIKSSRCQDNEMRADPSLFFYALLIFTVDTVAQTIAPSYPNLTIYLCVGH
jgi:hypothetical protein